MTNKSLTLRLPPDVYIRVLARRTKSITAYVVEAIEEKLERDRQTELASRFASLADTKDDDFELWQQAQREGMKHAGD